MVGRRLGVVGAAAAGILLLAAQAAYATGGGSNQGTAGVVFNNVTVGGITFSGTCTYFIGPSGLTIAGQASAAGGVVAETSIICRVQHASFQSVSSAAMPGPAVATATTSSTAVPGTAVCIAMSALTNTGVSASTGSFCVS
jgi:hypothetical protein